MSGGRARCAFRSATIAARQRTAVSENLNLFVTTRRHACCGFRLCKDSVNIPTLNGDGLMVERRAINVVLLQWNCGEIGAIFDRLQRAINPDQVLHISLHHRLLAEAGTPSGLVNFEQPQSVENEVAYRSRRKAGLSYLPMRAAKGPSHRVFHDSMTGARPMGLSCGDGRQLVLIDDKGEPFPCEIRWSSVGNVRHSDDVIRVDFPSSAMHRLFDGDLDRVATCATTRGRGRR